MCFRPLSCICDFPRRSESDRGTVIIFVFPALSRPASSGRMEKRRPSYSSRNAEAGSIRAIRKAGAAVAMRVTTASPSTTATMVAAS